MTSIWALGGGERRIAGKVRRERLKDYLFRDFHGDTDRTLGSGKPDDIISYPTIATPVLGRVRLGKNFLQIHLLDDDWAKKQAKAGTLSLAHMDINDGQILTASTEDLRKFMKSHADDKDALLKNFPLRRFE